MLVNWDNFTKLIVLLKRQQEGWLEVNGSQGGRGSGWKNRQKGRFISCAMRKYSVTVGSLDK